MSRNVLYIVSTLRKSGVTSQLYNILDHLHREFVPFILTLSPEGEDTDYERFAQLDAMFYSLGLSRFGGAIRGPFRLRSAVEEVDPDVVHTLGIRADTLSAYLLPEYDRVTTIQNHPYKDYPTRYGERRGTAMAWTHVHTFRRIDRPVACSETVHEQLSEYSVEAETIQNGVDCERYQPVSPAQRRRLRDGLDLPTDEPVIVFTGSLIPRKDPLTAIRGFLGSDVEGSTLVFLGDGPLRAECESIASSTDSIRFEGWVDSVKEYLGAADYFLASSRAEGLPNAVMEALATGLPVCLSDIGPHEEILQYDFRAGELFAAGDETELATVLDELLATDVNDRSEAAVGIARDWLSARSMSEEYQRLYSEIIC
ncbi:glycosyltransferase [Natronococcus occultus]|uniref:Glycosyltransferase n=1 Tax=Natronococcus occultus SP4 TaxID=694430 RepID=L0K4K8_9EURY|nr:glycosyltransferase [Natronococcus occultus]AGB39284.1 glycosyltransferase [Natronococcus occultus SP4]